MSLLFSIIERNIFHALYVPLHFFKVPFDFACLPRAAFGKAKPHRGTPKGAKMSPPSLCKRMAFFHAFLQAISFFKSPF